MRMVGSMHDSNGARDLQRLKWIGVVAPVAFVWLFEIVRFAIIEPAYRNDTAHLISALLMAGSVIVFAGLMAALIDRTQRRLIAQNKDLTATHAVSTAVRGGLSMSETLGHALERMVDQTGALAGVIRVDAGSSGPFVIRRPMLLPEGLAWITPLLDEEVVPRAHPVYERRAAIDTGVLDLPLIHAEATVGSMRLVLHPPVRPDLSPAALADITGEIATAVELGRAIADLQRRERERAALYEVALQLTGRAALHEILDTITGHARDLLRADRAVVCLDEGSPADPVTRAQRERIALIDDGSTCILAHPAGGPDDHPRNAVCPFHRADPVAAWMARPLRGPDGLFGELCVVREMGEAFNAADRSLLSALADMAAIAVRTARLHDAEQQWTILSERDRIARELHDSLAQVLGLIHLRLRALEPRLRGLPGQTLSTELAELAEIADDAYRDVREAILGLRETIPSDGGLEGALREYLKKYTRQTGIRASLSCEGDTQSALGPRAEVQLLRVVQEALTNVRKHSGAKQVEVTLDCQGPETVLAVADDGVGFDPDRLVEALDHGFGMATMRERVQQVGGTLDVHTAPGQGTRVIVRLQSEDPRVAPSPALAGAARR